MFFDFYWSHLSPRPALGRYYLIPIWSHSDVWRCETNLCRFRARVQVLDCAYNQVWLAACIMEDASAEGDGGLRRAEKYELANWRFATFVNLRDFATCHTVAI